MAKVIFMHFDETTDGVYNAKIGEPLGWVSKANDVPLPLDCSESYAECLITVENIGDTEPTSYMEDEELEKLVELGVLTEKEAEYCQQYTISPKVRIAPMMLVKGDVLIKPYKK